VPLLCMGLFFEMRIRRIMHLLLMVQLLTLLAVANGTPVIAARIFENALAHPLDGDATFRDGRRLFAASKTLRGVVLSIVATSATAPLIDLQWWVGTLIVGDLFSSFVKRRVLGPKRQGTRTRSHFRILASLVGLRVCLAAHDSRRGCRHAHVLCRRANILSPPIQVGDPRPSTLTRRIA
jgi:hypothetical protein